MVNPTADDQMRELVALGCMPSDARRAQLWYDDLLSSKMAEIRNGPFSRSVLSNISAWANEYSSRFSLLRDPPPTELAFAPKPFLSVVNKLYRYNVLLSPASPVKFADCLAELDDLVRLTIVCRYGDGPEFLVSKLHSLALGMGLNPQTKKRADDFGYYAIHFTFHTPIDVLSFETREVLSISLKVEMQLTTQLQASLRDLTHELYEVRRLAPKPDNDWKWDFANPLFQPSYTGHTLHLLEGLLLAMKQNSEKSHDDK